LTAQVQRAFLEEHKCRSSIELEKELGGEDVPKGFPKKDGSGRGKGQPGRGCGGNPRKRKGANR
jgi:hypothetical protein